MKLAVDVYKPPLRYEFSAVKSRGLIEAVEWLHNEEWHLAFSAVKSRGLIEAELR